MLKPSDDKPNISQQTKDQASFSFEHYPWGTHISGGYLRCQSQPFHISELLKIISSPY